MREEKCLNPSPPHLTVFYLNPAKTIEDGTCVNAEAETQQKRLFFLLICKNLHKKRRKETKKETKKERKTDTHSSIGGHN